MQNRLARIAAKYETEQRKSQAVALRALRKCDKAAARFVLKKWKDENEMSRVFSDMMIYGLGTYRIEHVPTYGPLSTPSPNSPTASR